MNYQILAALIVGVLIAGQAACHRLLCNRSLAAALIRRQRRYFR